MNVRQNVQRKGKKSYYYTIRTRFIIVFSVSLLAIIMMFAATYKIVKEQIMIASENTLHQFFRYVDGAADEANDLCASIAYAADFQQYSKQIVENPEKNTFYLSKVQQKLASHRSEKYYDIFAYYPAMDKIVSGIKGTLDWVSYCEVYYQDDDPEFLEAFRRVVDCEEKKPTWYGMTDQAGRDFLCVSMRQSKYRSSKYDCVLVIVLNPDYVTEWITGLEDDKQNGILFILDDENKLLFSNAAASLPEIISSGDEENASVHGLDHSYLTLTEKSEGKGISYSYAIPFSYFNQKMRNLYVISGLSIAFLLISGVIIIKTQTRKTYQPVANVVNILEKQEGAVYHGQNDSEFEYFRKILDQKSEAVNNLLRDVDKGVKTKRENFILSLLNGNVSDPMRTDNIFRDNGVSICSDFFCVAVFQGDAQEQSDEDIRFFAISNVMEELLNRENKGYMVALKKDLYVLLANISNKEEMQNVHQMLEYGQDFLKGYLNIRFTVGVSSLHEGMGGIHAAYEEAILALKYSFLLGEEIIIDYSEIATRKYEDLKSSELEMLRMVTAWLSEPEEVIPADELTDEILEKCGIDQSSSMEMVEYFKYESATMFKRVMMHEGIWNSEWNHRVRQLFNQDSLKKLRDTYARLLTILRLEKREKDRGMDVCVRVRNYIEENYSDEQLTVTFLGDMTGVDSSYLSKKFKEKYDCTISEFITNTRILNAKVQLKSTKLSIKEIAENNGFVNSNSFIRTFKRNEGLTPGAYRDLFLL